MTAIVGNERNFKEKKNMEERQNLYDMAYRSRKNYRICGERIAREESFYMDGYDMVHMNCFFQHQRAEEVECNGKAV